jgi:hypothetical protein
MIRISTLPLIESAEQFHAAKQILLVDVLFVGDAPRDMREYIKNNHGGFVYDKKTYVPITLTGAPESLLANVQKPIIFKFDRGFESHYFFDSELEIAIWHKKLYDISSLMNEPSIAFEREETFITERYLSGVVPYPVKPEENRLLTFPPKAPSIGTSAMKGLKPVRK